MCQPKIIYVSTTVDSKESNIEKGCNTKVMFVDHNEPTDYNGGYDTSQQFSTSRFKNILGESNYPPTYCATMKIKTCTSYPN